MNRQNFTFLEMIVVAAIMALVAVIALPQVSRAPRRLEREGALSSIRQMVREVGMRARATGAPLKVILDMENSLFRVEKVTGSLEMYQDWQPEVKASEEAKQASFVALQSKDEYPISGSVEWLPGDTGLDDGEEISYSFFEDGQAVGHPLRFSVGGVLYQMDVDRLTGSPLIEELE